MKKLLFIVLATMLLSFLPANAIIYETETFSKDAKMQQWVSEVSFKILNANRVDKIITAYYNPKRKEANAYMNHRDRHIEITKGLMRFIESEEELAAVVSHEIAHAIASYRSYFQYIPMGLNSKAYEFQADKKAVDLMVNAGYNPLAIIVIDTKLMSQARIDWVPIFCTHPKTSRRLATVYDYIYMKYPQYLANNEYKDDIYYQNFLLTSKENRKRFEVKTKNPSDRSMRVKYK